MLPTLNGKSFLDCTEKDLEELIDNPDYRENEYIDYKANFSFLDMPKKHPDRIKHIVEFRSDICAFANASGGFLIYGISDSKGMAKSIEGVEIEGNDTDKFELDRKNNLTPILPKLPPIQFKFVELSNGNYVVIIYVRRDSFTPYIHIENEVNYKIYKRIGNGKCSIGYVELKNMFNQSRSIENEVDIYRKKRIDYYRSQEDTSDYRYSKFLLLHIFPDTFIDSTYRKNLFLLQKQQSDIKLYSIFEGTGCNFNMQPNVDGLRYPSCGDGMECSLGNNGIAECFFPLYKYLERGTRTDDLRFPTEYIWEKLEPVIDKYISVMKEILETKRIFVCISVLGCKNVISESREDTFFPGSIDRDTVICNPVVIEDIEDIDEFDTSIKWLQIEYRLALGVKSSKKLSELIEEVTGDCN
ncbi:MAG: ATP-binding protein [Ruminococcaceae bacterium]|nr:ATP-binding protein [Oscillospiraceae bacterium]